MNYKINDEVKIISGQYKDYKGKILEIDINNKTLLVEIWMFEKNIKKEFKFEEIIDLDLEKEV